MKKHLFNSIAIASFFLFSITLNSCSEYVQGDTNNLASNYGSIQIKILSGKDSGKTFTHSGLGTVIGTKRTVDGKFFAYQIVGTYQNIHIGCNTTEENGTSAFESGSISFTDISSNFMYSSIEDKSGSIKITDIKLLQSYDQVGAQLMNGKMVFKGKFEKEKFTSMDPDETDILIEGTITF